MVAGIAVVAIVIWVCCRCYAARTKIYNVPDGDKFKEMPTIAL